MTLPVLLRDFWACPGIFLRSGLACLGILMRSGLPWVWWWCVCTNLVGIRMASWPEEVLLSMSWGVARGDWMWNKGEEWCGQASSFNWEIRREKAEGKTLLLYLDSVLKHQTPRSSHDAEIAAETCAGCHSLASNWDHTISILDSQTFTPLNLYWATVSVP